MANEENVLFRNVPESYKSPAPRNRLTKEQLKTENLFTQNLELPATGNVPFTNPEPTFSEKVNNQFRNDSIIKFSIISLIVTLISLLLYFRYKRLGKS